MASVPGAILLGVYLGLLVGTLPALFVWGLGFGFRRFTNVTLPWPAVLVVALVLASVNAGVLRFADTTVAETASALSVVTALVVVTGLALYAHSHGSELAKDLPRERSLATLRGRGLSRETADISADGEEVRVRVVGDVADMEGYPPLSEELRAQLRNTEYTFPSDLRLGELESRLEARLQTEYDLGDVSATVDERGRATVVAAPPFSGLSKRIDDNRHAVSVTGLVPTGLARGDEVTIITPNAQVRGTVLSADVRESTNQERLDSQSVDEPEDATPVRAATTAGGEGRLTVAVTRTDVQPLLRAQEVKVVVESRGTRREYEAVSVIRRADQQIRRVSLTPESPLAGRTVGELQGQADGDATILALQRDRGWQVGPRNETPLQAGDEVFAAGTAETLATLTEGNRR